MSKYEEANLILRLYELRREETMRQARDWFFREFNPKSAADITEIMFGEHSGHLRMVVSYWDMAATIVNQGAISPEFFAEANGEHLSVFAKIEPFLAEMRSGVGPQFLANLEKLIDRTPGARERVAALRERLKAILAELAARKTSAAAQS